LEGVDSETAGLRAAGTITEPRLRSTKNSGGRWDSCGDTNNVLYFRLFEAEVVSEDVD